MNSQCLVAARLLISYSLMYCRYGNSTDLYDSFANAVIEVSTCILHSIRGQGFGIVLVQLLVSGLSSC